MSKQAFVDQEIVLVTLGIPIREMTVLKETLRLSGYGEKDPVKWIMEKAFGGCVSLASSTVQVSHWKDLEGFASRLGVESPV